MDHIRPLFCFSLLFFLLLLEIFFRSRKLALYIPRIFCLKKGNSITFKHFKYFKLSFSNCKKQIALENMAIFLKAVSLQKILRVFFFFFNPILNGFSCRLQKLQMLQIYCIISSLFHFNTEYVNLKKKGNYMIAEDIISFLEKCGDFLQVYIPCTIYGEKTDLLES